MRLATSMTLFGPKRMKPNTTAISPVENAIGRPSRSRPIMPPNIRTVTSSTLMRSAVAAPGLREMKQGLGQHEKHAQRKDRFQHHRNGHVPGPAAGLDQGDGGQ